MKTTYETLFRFDVEAQKWLNASEQNPNTKLGYAIRRVHERVEQIQRRYNRIVQDIHADNCATDDKGVMMTNEFGGFKHKPEGFKAVNRAIQLLDESEVEIESYYAKEVPELDDYQKYLFAGFVIRPLAAEAFIEEDHVQHYN